MSDFGVTPERLAVRDILGARHALADSGAVVLTGLPVTPDALAVAAAHLYGQDLRQLFPVRERASRDGGPVHLHADSFDQVVDIGGVADRRRDPDEDAVNRIIEVPGIEMDRSVRSVHALEVFAAGMRELGYAG